MWVRHLRCIFMRSQLFSFLYRRMAPQKTRTGLIQILAPIRLRVTHQEEFVQAWWAEQIKQLLPCSICRSEYWPLSHLAICDYRLSTYFLAYRVDLHYESSLSILSVYLFTTENDLLILVWNTCVEGFLGQSPRVSVQQFQIVAALANLMKKALHLHWLRICPSLHISQLCHSCS